MESLHCDECEQRFEVDLDIAEFLKKQAADPDTCHIPVLCDDCCFESLNYCQHCARDDNYCECLYCNACGQNVNEGCGCE